MVQVCYKNTHLDPQLPMCFLQMRTPRSEEEMVDPEAHTGPKWQSPGLESRHASKLTAAKINFLEANPAQRPCHGPPSPNKAQTQRGK